VTPLEMIAVMFFTGGLFFLAVGTIGLLRMPDVYTRMHATAKCDTLGTALTLLGAALISHSLESVIKLMMLWALVWVISPTATHMIAGTAYKRGVAPVPGTRVLDYYTRDKEGVTG